MSKLTYIRVLQHDTEDNILIGPEYPVENLEMAKKNIIESYEKRSEWCGGFTAACKEYYREISIVDSKSLKCLKSIYNKTKVED